MNEETLLLKSAATEIKHLRESNNLMAARLDMFDKMMSLFYTQPNFGNCGGFSPDILWQIEQHLEKTKTKQDDKNY